MDVGAQIVECLYPYNSQPYLCSYLHQKVFLRSWRASSEVKRAYCSYRGLEFTSQHPNQDAHNRL
ncbi:hypothetical protein I79_005396 [Cricetulus griseus]|uniref:Uncharacterized protein n=1 Tax=Cricetulus griseus TaxID=10029 RepID=G3H527_CRIGR|nr:hypothetical protein I79_005396 [Cricetulus griseus]